MDPCPLCILQRVAFIALGVVFLVGGLHAPRGGGRWFYVGLLVLIATPVLRVAVSILAFWQEGDRKFVLITSVVLALLLASFLLGKVGG